jgi:CheY-like chemotaxis protein
MSHGLKIFRGPTALLVEPDAEIRDYLTTILKDAGCTCVVEVGDASQAIEILGRNLIDLLVVACRLPKIHGLQLVEQAKGLEPTLPVILITGDRHDERLLGHNADVLLEKPLRLRMSPKSSCSSVRARTEKKIAIVEAKIAELGRIKTALVALAASCTRGDAPTSACPILDAIDQGEGEVAR